MIARRVGHRDHAAPTEAVDADAAMDAQNAPTAAWKSRTPREIPTAPTAIIFVDEDNEHDQGHYHWRSQTGNLSRSSASLRSDHEAWSR